MARQRDKLVTLSLKSTLNGEITGQICHIDFKVDFKKRDNVTNLLIDFKVDFKWRDKVTNLSH